MPGRRRWGPSVVLDHRDPGCAGPWAACRVRRGWTSALVRQLPKATEPAR